MYLTFKLKPSGYFPCSYHSSRSWLFYMFSAGILLYLIMPFATTRIECDGLQFGTGEILVAEMWGYFVMLGLDIHAQNCSDGMLV